MKQNSKVIHEKYEFRNIHKDEIEQAAEIESICFPPNEACTYEHMESRIKKASDLFLVVVDRETGKIAGFLNGLATDREHLTDDFFEIYQRQFLFTMCTFSGCNRCCMEISDGNELWCYQ